MFLKKYTGNVTGFAEEGVLELGRGLVQVGVAAGEPYMACCIHDRTALQRCIDVTSSIRY